MANAAVFGGLVLLLCIGLFIAGVRMDESSMMPMRHDADADKMPDMMPMRRSLEALQYENTLLRSQINATFVENSLLRTKLRAALPPGAKLDVDLIPQQRPALPTPRMVRISVGSAAGAASDTGRRPRALAERLRQSTEFTQERARAVATNNQIILTFVNRVRLDFATTWVMHVKRLGLTNWLIGATDRASLRELKRSRYPCFDMSTNLPEGEWPWGSPSFKALGPHKIELIYKSIVWGLEVVITDIDALVLREPFAFFKPWPDAGFLTTSDHLGNTTSDGKLEDHRGIHTAFNIGCAHRLPPGALRSAGLPARPPARPPASAPTAPFLVIRARRSRPQTCSSASRHCRSWRSGGRSSAPTRATGGTRASSTGSHGTSGSPTGATASPTRASSGRVRRRSSVGCCPWRSSAAGTTTLCRSSRSARIRRGSPTRSTRPTSTRPPPGSATGCARPWCGTIRPSTTTRPEGCSRSHSTCRNACLSAESPDSWQDRKLMERPSSCHRGACVVASTRLSAGR